VQATSGHHPIKGQQIVGNIVATVYSAIIRELAAKGKDARFRKTGRGQFAANPAKKG
jgi:hypothetical protein